LERAARLAPKCFELKAPMAHSTKTQFVHSFLLLAWVTILLLELTIPVQSQGCLPPLVTPGYMNPINVTWGSWRPAIGDVTVKIDSYFSEFTGDATFRIEDGQRMWNSQLTCAAVTFTNFQDVLFMTEDLLSPAPFGEVHWEVDTPSHSFNAEVIGHIGFGARVEGATIKVRPNLVFSNPVYFNYLGSHEIGHTFNLNDCLSDTTPKCTSPGLSIMGGHTNTSFDAQGPTACDFAAVANIYCPSSPTPTPTPTPAQTEDDCQNAAWYWNFAGGYCQQDVWCTLEPLICDLGSWSSWRCQCVPSSPVIVDLLGNGFALTSETGGVPFDLNSDGSKEQMAWTALGSDDGWLVLDRNNNGLIDNGSELFGNFSPQPEPPLGKERNGFFALREYDKVSNGGNDDGLITREDAVFGELRLWQDVNHNGISEAGELRPMHSANVATLELGYKPSKYIDKYGNEFRYRAKVKDTKGAQVGRWMWDVFLVSVP
ncbi:MAG TPA: hypothetical protein VFS77_11065, partial [Pyrinomonadaceae bacterium]|nr:hypothetical protein [Pyrinomonadaceae bacterium]